MVIIPLQDILLLDSSARMNIPGTAEGNWQWRLKGDELTAAVAGELRALTEKHHRTFGKG
jgi:4-alpha-glucanotransferase